jgi:hypothetical protein
MESNDKFWSIVTVAIAILISVIAMCITYDDTHTIVKQLHTTAPRA